MALDDRISHVPFIQTGAAIIIENDNKEILLQERTDRNKWGLPGGCQDLGEDLRETAVREAYEETGLKFEPREKYSDNDLDWMNKQSRSSVEMNNNIKPEIVNKVSNLGEYDIICVAFPIWWYKEPTIIDKFLEENNMDGKKIYSKIDYSPMVKKIYKYNWQI